MIIAIILLILAAFFLGRAIGYEEGAGDDCGRWRK